MLTSYTKSIQFFDQDTIIYLEMKIFKLYNLYYLLFSLSIANDSSILEYVMNLVAKVGKLEGKIDMLEEMYLQPKGKSIESRNWIKNLTKRYQEVFFTKIYFF